MLEFSLFSSCDENSEAERIVAQLELTRDTIGPIHAALMDERIRASRIWGSGMDMNPFYGLKEPIDLKNWRAQLGVG